LGGSFGGLRSYDLPVPPRHRSRASSPARADEAADKAAIAARLRGFSAASTRATKPAFATFRAD